MAETMDKYQFGELILRLDMQNKLMALLTKVVIQTHLTNPSWMRELDVILKECSSLTFTGVDSTPTVEEVIHAHKDAAEAAARNGDLDDHAV